MSYDLTQSEDYVGEVIGIVPAAGKGTRAAQLPCSKEIFPIGFASERDGAGAKPKVAFHYLLEKMRFAGITRVYIVLREGKWDIPAYLGDGKSIDMHIAYLMMGLPYGVPYTVDQAFPFVQNSIVAFGHPDTLFEPDDAFLKLLDRMKGDYNDLVLGLFPSDRPDKTDMVDVAENGRIGRILIKPGRSNLQYTWAIAVWKPIFTHFIHDHLVSIGRPTKEKKELFMSEVIQAAILRGLKVSAVKFSGESLLDIGTPDDLLRAVKRLSVLL